MYTVPFIAHFIHWAELDYCKSLVKHNGNSCHPTRALPMTQGSKPNGRGELSGCRIPVMQRFMIASPVFDKPSTKRKEVTLKPFDRDTLGRAEQ